MLRMLAVRDLEAKYRKFRLGLLWTLLEPLGMTVVIWFVFSVLLGTQRLGLSPYFLFLAVAILPWWWFTKGLSATTRIFHRDQPALAISLLPTQVWILRVLIASFIEFALSLPIIVAAVLITQAWPSWLIVLFPVAIAVQFAIMYGLALLIAAGAIVVPDLARIVRIVLRALFYLSPVLYAVSNIPERAQSFAGLNPVVGMLGLYRVPFWPAETVAFRYELTALAIAALLGIAGALAFRRAESRILKEA